jgi:aerobic carbon-monoxide dehydrogenase small subunit
VLEREPDISDEDLLDVLSSNLCRCTGYQNIIKAVRAAAVTMRENGRVTPGTGRSDTGR